MKVSFVAGFGPIVRDIQASLSFWGDGLGNALREAESDYFTSESLDGTKYFALWSLPQAAQAVFGQPEWPDDVPVPQAWIELDVESPDAVEAAIRELEAGGHRVLNNAHEEPWGQTTSRLLSPEGLLVGVTYTPWMHPGAAEGPITES